MFDSDLRVIRTFKRLHQLIELHGTNLPRPVRVRLLRLITKDLGVLESRRDRMRAATAALRIKKK